MNTRFDEIHLMGLGSALYGNPSVLLMDEGTANLDPVNEEKILDAISKLDITRILIAHRPRTLEKASRVFALVEGQMTEVRKKQGSEVTKTQVFLEVEK